MNNAYNRPTSKGYDRRAVAWCLLAVILCLPNAVHADMTIRDYDAKRHDRFYSGNDKAFVGESYDWSGVGNASNRWVTMVSPTYFLSASHLKPTGSVTFYEENSKSTGGHTYTIAGGQRISVGGNGTDLWLGKLTTSLDPAHQIKYYSVLDRPSEASYIGMELYNYGKPDRVGRNVVDSFVTATVSGYEGRSMIFDYDDDNVIDVGGDETKLVSGDSGGPSFTPWNGELTLMGIHWFIDTDADGKELSGDTFVPAYINAINDAMDGESLTVVPEPATMALWLLALLGLAVSWRRWR